MNSPPFPAADPSICLIIPYFGRWPFWFPFFLESCRSNPSINWRLHTDCGIPENLPPNVQIVETSFAAYCRKVGETLALDFLPSNPYKLCDLKPALGQIHENELAAYDFWGFGDIDLIYGNIRHHYTAERLSRFDIFSTHRRRISGHFCLLRNTPLMREAFKSVPNWQSLLSRAEHVTFDESAFSRLFVRHKNWPNWLADLVKPLHKWARRCEHIEAFSTPNAGLAWTDGSRDFPEKWFWQDGVLTNNKDGQRAFPYLHFMMWKHREWPQSNAPTAPRLAQLAASRNWQIDAYGFHPLKQK